MIVTAFEYYSFQMERLEIPESSCDFSVQKTQKNESPDQSQTWAQKAQPKFLLLMQFWEVKLAALASFK